VNGRWKEVIPALTAPLAWAAATQLGQILPHLDCERSTSWSLVTTVIGAFVAMTGISLSSIWRGERDGTRSFIGHTTTGIALVITFALLLQGIAAQLLDPCQR